MSSQPAVGPVELHLCSDVHGIGCLVLSALDPCTAASLPADCSRSRRGWQHGRQLAEVRQHAAELSCHHEECISAAPQFHAAKRPARQQGLLWGGTTGAAACHLHFLTPCAAGCVATGRLTEMFVP